MTTTDEDFDATVAERLGVDVDKVTTVLDEALARAEGLQVLGALMTLAGLPVAPRTCRGCGCTDDRPCAGGCAWADWDLCTTCARREFASPLPRRKPLPESPGLPVIGKPATLDDEAPAAVEAAAANVRNCGALDQADLEAMTEAIFPGIDFCRARVQGRLAQAMASIECARIEAGRDPELRALVDELLVDGSDFLLTALKLTLAPR